MGGGKGTSRTGPPGVVKDAMNSQFSASLPVLQLLAKQFTEALSTGGVGAKIPIIQRAVEAGRHATSQASQNTDSALARSGVGGPFAQMVKSGQQQQGDFAVSQISPAIIQELISMANDFGMLRGSGAFGASSPVGKSQEGWGSILGAIAEMGKAGAMAYAACWVALELYGPSMEFVQARRWITQRWKGRTANVVRFVYGRYGYQLSLLVRRSRFVRALVKPLFDVAVRKGV